ncbi:MAG: phosphotriesterase [Pseudorhodoplanes sp.]
MPAATSHLKGKVQTVLGTIEPDELGVTLIHDHLLVDVTCYCRPSPAASEQALANQPVSLKNLTWIRRNWTSNFDNMRLDDIDVAIEEIGHYKRAGGNTVVDVGNVGLGRDPSGLAQISRASGLHIVMGAGYYVHQSHPANMDDITEKQITEEIIRDITVGVNNTGIKSGIIGEIGCSWPITPNEHKSLKAAANAQKETGAPMSVHVGRHLDSPVQIAKDLQDWGVDISRVALCHLDREWPADLDKMWRLADTGIGMELDTWGLDTWNYPLAPMDRLTDAQRIDLILMLKERGHLKQITLAHDLGYKHRLVMYGGSGYDHLLVVGVPLMRRKGLSEEDINMMLVDNPKHLLAFV